MTSYRCLIFAGVLVAGCSPHSTGQPPKPKPAKTAEDGRVVLTEAAAAEIRKHLKKPPETTYLRVSLDDNLKLDIVSARDPKKDLLSESQGIPVVVDKKVAAALPLGIVLDFHDDSVTSGFKFRSPGSERVPDTTVSLIEARRKFKTNLQPRNVEKTAAPEPPAKLFQVVKYDAIPGKLVAYVTPDPKDGKKRPAIIWITGGDCNTIDEGCWREGSAQSAFAYRNAGIVMMFPSQRGGNDNPGVREGFLGEVDDVLAAATFLRKQPHVDPDRIYLGGHSTGGTLALLTAECSDLFRAVFSFGPTDDVVGYGFGNYSFSYSDAKELHLRSPIRWLHSISSPVFVIEGEEGGNSDALRTMERSTKNPNVKFFAIKGANHFNVLGPANDLIVKKILADTERKCNLVFSQEEFNKQLEKKDR